MGLDITAYKNLKIVENPILDEDAQPLNWETEWKPGASMEWSESVFQGRGEGVDSNTVYTWEDSFRFRAGSYSGYNMWRSKLEDFATGDQFQELINFADNEGVIGPVDSKKLAKDFIDNELSYIAFIACSGVDEDWYIDKYMDWKNAFIMASENGAVDFH
jgi:hypothetical protein